MAVRAPRNRRSGAAIGFLALSTIALEGSDAARTGGWVPLALRHADLALLALALPVFALAGWPLVGYAGAAAAWLVQHAILLLGERRSVAALRRGDRRLALGLFAGATLGRVWLVAAAVLVTGIAAEREDGLAAALLVAALVTSHLAGRAVARLFEPTEVEAPR